MGAFESPHTPEPAPPDRRRAETARLARSAGRTGLATLTSRILGLVRDQVLAALFGAGNEMDAFLVAFRDSQPRARPVRGRAR